MKKFLTLLAMAASLLAVSCHKPGEEEDDEQEQGGGQGLAIKIDGQFDDWGSLKPEEFTSAKNNPNSPWDAVTEIRCCADKDFVYYYIRYNSSAAKEQLEENDALNIRLNINTDGEFTSGYANYSLDAYDFIVEGALADKAGQWTAFAGTLHQRVWSDEDGKDVWKVLIPSSGGLVTGKGNGGEYEILLARELFNNAVPAKHKMGDVFHTGIRFYYGGWNEFSNMPNTSVAEGDGNGWGHLMEVKTVK
jgi:hypothetical protein